MTLTKWQQFQIEAEKAAQAEREEKEAEVAAIAAHYRKLTEDSQAAVIASRDPELGYGESKEDYEKRVSKVPGAFGDQNAEEVARASQEQVERSEEVIQAEVVHPEVEPRDVDAPKPNEEAEPPKTRRRAPKKAAAKS